MTMETEVRNVSFQKIDVKELSFNPFVKIGTEWMLITAGDGEKVNTMTASWGGLGVLWSDNVGFVFIRPQRYTREFVDKADRFTLSFFDGDYKKELGVLGKRSGRDGDKIADVGFTVRDFDGVPAFEQASLVLVMKKLYRDTIKSECFIEKDADTQHYPDKDYHIVYIGRVEAAYRRV